MLDTLRVHSRNARILAVVAAGTTLVIVAQMVVAGQWIELLRYSGPLALFMVFVWAACWSPYVECGPGGVQLNNVLSIITLPWPAIHGVDGRFGLTLDTAYGEFTAWSASRPRLRNAPSDRDAPPNAAAEVTRVWTELRAAGHLDNPRLEPDARPHRWRVGVIELAIALSAWTAFTILLTR